MASTRSTLPLYSHRFLVDGGRITGKVGEIDGLDEAGVTSEWSEMSSPRPLVMLDGIAAPGQITLRRPLLQTDDGWWQYWKEVREARKKGGDLGPLRDTLKISLPGKGTSAKITYSVSGVLPVGYTAGRRLLAGASGFAVEELVVVHLGIDYA